VVELSASGVGDVAWDAPDALPAIEELLGPADAVEDFPAECGLADAETARWGPVTVGLQDGALLSWQVDETAAVPDGVSLPADVTPGDTLADVAALPGAVPPVHLENYQVFQTEVADPEASASLFYWTDGDTPDSPVTLVIGRSILGCG
jgi:hypothetical protein